MNRTIYIISNIVIEKHTYCSFLVYYTGTPIIEFTNNGQLITVHLHLPTGTNCSEGGLQYVVWADRMLIWRQRYVPRRGQKTTRCEDKPGNAIKLEDNVTSQQSHNV